MPKLGERLIVTADVEAGLRRALAAAGSNGRIAVDLGLNKSTVGRWRRVPAEWCIPIEKLYGVPRAVLRPDLFGGP